MANYTVDIEIAKEWVDIYNGSSMKLCMAKAVKGAGGKELYNVIAKTVDSFQPKMSFSWTDEYTISATTQYFSAGAQITGTAEPHDINFGQTYNIKSWTKVMTFDDSSQVDDQSFGFSNQLTCNILLSMKMDDKKVPVYISPMPVAPGMTTLTPIPKVVFWFQDSVNTSTMITHFLGSSITVKPTPGSEHSKIKFNKEGKWETVV